MIWIESVRPIDKDRNYVEPPAKENRGFSSILAKTEARICREKGLDIRKLRISDSAKNAITREMWLQ